MYGMNVLHVKHSIAWTIQNTIPHPSTTPMYTCTYSVCTLLLRDRVVTHQWEDLETFEEMVSLVFCVEYKEYNMIVPFYGYNLGE